MSIKERRSTIQPIGWVRDMSNAKLLDLSPRYQRRSVWNKEYQQFFVDSIFKNYPVPPLFINLEVTKDGTTLYHVIDGKQRLLSIIEFLKDGFAASSKSFSPPEIAGKYFSGLDQSLQRAFYSYFLPFEFFTEITDEAVVQIFDRFNRNVQKLNDQELRHAKFSGRFASLMEELADDVFWKDLDFFGTTDILRMKDVEYVAIIFVLTMQGITEGDDLDVQYAEYDEEIPDAAIHLDRYQRGKQMIGRITNIVKETRFRNRADFYSLWSALLDHIADPDAVEWNASGESLRKFSELVNEIGATDDPTKFPASVQQYSQAVRAGTNKQQNRETRKTVLLNQLVMK